MTTVYVLNMQKEPLMPTTRCDHVRRLLKNNVAKGEDTAKLQILKHPPQLKNPKRWLPGCLVYVGNKPGIMTGTSGTQATKGGKRRPSYCDFTDGRKERFSQCRFVLRNTGLVYV